MGFQLSTSNKTKKDRKGKREEGFSAERYGGLRSERGKKARVVRKRSLF